MDGAYISKNIPNGFWEQSHVLNEGKITDSTISIPEWCPSKPCLMKKHL